MSRWDDQFEAHGVFQSIENARKQLEAASEEIPDPADRESHARLVRVLDHLEGVLGATDPELVPFPVLDQLTVGLNQLAAHVGQYAAAPNAATLDQANGQADQLLQQALPLAPRVASEDVQDLQSAVSSFRRSAGQHLRNVETEAEGALERIQQLSEQLATQKQEIDAQDSRLDALVNQWQSQFSTAQDQRQTQFASALEEARASIRATVEQAQSDTKAALGQATEKLGELLSDGETRTAALLESVQERADDQHNELTTASKERMDELDELLEKAVRTVGAIGSTGMAGGYKVVANDEKNAANIWRRWAFLALLGAIGATIFAVAHGVVHGFSVDTFFAKWAISVPFLALAGYAARESSKHREQATTNRKLELQLASLDTYLVSLPEDKQEDVKVKIADRYFFGELPAPTESATPELD